MRVEMWVYTATDYLSWTNWAVWRRGWDSNPRALSDKTLSRRPRYDHFGTSPQENQWSRTFYFNRNRAREPTVRERHTGESRSASQQFERVRPAVCEEPGNAPENTERLDRAGSLDLPHIRHIESELIENRRDLAFGTLVVTADKHRRLRATEVGIDHEGVANAAEGFHEMRVGSELLQSLHERFVQRGEKAQHPIHGGRIGNRICRINNGLAVDVRDL